MPKLQDCGIAELLSVLKWSQLHWGGYVLELRDNDSMFGSIKTKEPMIRTSAIFKWYTPDLINSFSFLKNDFARQV